MAKKTVLSASEQFELRQALHVAVLDALIASRRWSPGELVFQGGTSLHLAHGSPRFSEDLDFLVSGAMNLEAIGASVQARLCDTAWLPRGTQLVVSKAKDGHNPHAFVVSVGGAGVIGAVRVKVELWKTTKESMAPLSVEVATVRLASGPAAGAQAFVPTASLREIYVDKVFAAAARPYVKPRDLFDLDWIIAREPDLAATPNGRGGVTAAELRLRLATYPNESPAAWLEKARVRAAALPAQVAMVATDLRRWLPSSWPMTDQVASRLVAVSVKALEQGIQAMEIVRLTWTDVASNAAVVVDEELAQDGADSDADASAMALAPRERMRA